LGRSWEQCSWERAGADAFQRAGAARQPSDPLAPSCRSRYAHFFRQNRRL